MGRGPHHLPAANGAGLNTGHYAVLGLGGSKGFTEPTDGLLHGILDAVDYLREHGNAGREIKGHRDGYATDCPGGPLYAWVKRGAPRPSAQPTKTELPTLKPGYRGPHNVTNRRLVGAANQTSEYYDPTDADLVALVNAFKATHGLPANSVWDGPCWKAARPSPK
jgi:hypothetical protein